jgi:hypothetical protein
VGFVIGTVARALDGSEPLGKRWRPVGMAHAVDEQALPGTVDIDGTHRAHALCGLAVNVWPIELVVHESSGAAILGTLMQLVAHGQCTDWTFARAGSVSIIERATERGLPAAVGARLCSSS